jgi:hypothetical protein
MMRIKYLKKPSVRRLPRIRRTCLKCDEEFWARGRLNRICGRCTESNRQLADANYTVYICEK